MLITIPVSVGELADKITILEIKQMNIKDMIKIKSVNRELKLLKDIAKKNSILDKYNKSLLLKLKKINLKLWNIEDRKRKCEKNKDFGKKFIKLARDVYLLNDKRALIKLEINILCGSNIIEIKSYDKY